MVETFQFSLAVPVAYEWSYPKTGMFAKFF